MRSVRLVPSACLVFVVTVTLLGCAPPLAPRPQSTRSTDSKVVVFVCDHGVAKSALAAALFNDMAVKRGLSLRAERRAADTPRREPSLSTDKGLAADGLPIPEGVPLQLSARDIREALRVVTLGISRPVGHRREERGLGRRARGRGRLSGRPRRHAQAHFQTDRRVDDEPTLTPQPFSVPRSANDC